ncbi:MAG: DUF1028 domain-containing protein [Candidatus Zixiibacteriota bacterium]|nr:MAG: DUF1028 domain-containing protein [candidate division Zixibacteria bacterium]
MTTLSLLFAALAILPSACLYAGANEITPQHLVHTFSIVAYDSATGQFGAAVQSHWFKVVDVIWLEAGVGAVATQSLVEFSYGPLGLEMMKAGKSAKQALDGLLASDSLNRIRQVAMIDKNGVVATHTGSKCIAYAGHHVGKNYSCQANLMKDSTVWGAMAKAFENTSGDLADRMMAALEAAQAEGGDIRGKQSAAMVVVSGKPTGRSWVDRQIDIRVDDSPEPLVELRRLLNISRAYDHMNKGDEAIAVKDWNKANDEYSQASKLASGNLEIMFWYAVTLVTAGEVDRSLPLFKEIFKADPNWRTLVPRLVDADQLPNDPAVIKKIVAQ